MAKKKKKSKKKVTRVSAASKIDSIYSALITRLEKAESFTLEHAPDVCKEIVESKVVMYQNRAILGAGNLLWSLLALGAGAFLIHQGFISKSTCDGSRLMCHSVEFYVFGGISAFIGAISVVCHISYVIDNLLEIREINVSKKLTVLRGLKQLVGGRR